MTKLVIGQQLFEPGTRTCKRRFLTVTKVGRKWASVKETSSRVDISTLCIGEQGYNWTQLYLTREAWEAEYILRSAWSHLKLSLPYSPKNITLAQVENAIRALGANAKIWDERKARIKEESND